MKTATVWNAGWATDSGLERTVNEDRILVDEGRGLFLVVDGLGGHAAGELAAETAVRVIDAQLADAGSERGWSSAEESEERIRAAIAAANNEIYELAQSNPDWHGMACVLTLAVVNGERVSVGHVGDSRLYLMWNGRLRKLTSDHSPVGEQEDQGELSEEQAMQHPRRNEVFRDVGSYPRAADDGDFIETRSFLLRPDAALLACSDGLSDCVSSAEMTEIAERYDGDAGRVAQLLVEAANAAGGRDNISVVFVAGPEFIGSQADSLIEIRPRHATTRMREERGGHWNLLRSVLLLLGGMLLGMLLWRLLDRTIERPVVHEDPPPARSPKSIAVNAADSLGIIKALGAANPGDTVSVPPGEYLGPLLLRDRVNVIATEARQSIVRSDPASTVDVGLAIVARGIPEGRVKGLTILGDDTHPLRTGVWLENSGVEIEDVEVSGAIDAGIRIEGAGQPLLIGNFVHGNAGAGIVVASGRPRLVGNRLSDNGLRSSFPASSEQEIRANNLLLEAPQSRRLERTPVRGRGTK
jgi:parallel beta-helix repeat protein